ncbi:MAG TPA: helical backbone metal receptor [Gemmatimonadaceae bacterium]|nr:helical backbone metal receptor [Gemmatimonadaceae bacterium]
MLSRIASLLIVLASLACGGRSAPATSAGTDDFGAPVRAGTARVPARIVSLNPTTTELLFAIGAGDRVVGRTHWDVWPDAARRVADLGPGLRPNVEAILARRPDLVVLYASADDRDAARRLADAGVPVIALKVDRIADFRRAALLLGAATGELARARLVADTVERSLARVRAATAALPRPTVFWHVWDAPIITIGRGSYLDELLDVAGGRNVYGDLAQPSPQVALEDIVRRDPDVILAGAAGAAQIRASVPWRAVGAVRRGRVLVVDTNLVGRPSVRMGEAAASIARLLHPGALP